MTRSPLRDALVGLFVLAGVAAGIYLSLAVGGLSYAGPHGLRLIARFDETGGLKVGAPAAIAGVKVGQITAISLDPEFRARIDLDLDSRLSLPIDTSASIMTAGLLGDRYLDIQVGGDSKLLRSGDEITFTQSAVILERLIGKLIHGADLGDGSAKTATPAPTDGKAAVPDRTRAP